MSIPDYKLEFSCTDLMDNKLKEYNVWFYGNDLGIICMKVVDGNLEVHNLFIDEAFRGQAHGANLLTQLQQYVGELIAVDVIPDAEGFWEKQGATILRHKHFMKDGINA